MGGPRQDGQPGFKMLTWPISEDAPAACLQTLRDRSTANNGVQTRRSLLVKAAASAVVLEEDAGGAPKSPGSGCTSERSEGLKERLSIETGGAPSFQQMRQLQQQAPFPGHEKYLQNPQGWV
ncbi:hypothetical protein ACSSS7_001014 [Eimeria intestinalis]